MAKKYGFKGVINRGDGWTGPQYPGLIYPVGKVVSVKLNYEQTKQSRSTSNCAAGINICEKATDAVGHTGANHQKGGILLVSYDTRDILGPRRGGELMTPRTKLRVKKVTVERLLYTRPAGEHMNGHERTRVEEKLLHEQQLGERRVRDGIRRKMARMKRTGKKRGT